MRALFCGILLLTLAAILPVALEAQIATINDTTSTPIPGVGHDYIKLLSETVNPANGSLSLRIQVPMPKGRGITVPFAFAYDSNGLNHLVPYLTSPGDYFAGSGNATWRSNSGSFAQGGWSYVFPSLRLDAWTQDNEVVTGYNGSTPIYTDYPCLDSSNYLFSDGTGGIHSLGLGSQNAAVPPPSGCLGWPGPSTSGGDPQVFATLSSITQALPVTVYDATGTVYNFAYQPGGLPATSPGLPTYIEDRNGNRVTTTQNKNISFSFIDTLGRTVLSANGFGPSGATNTVVAGALTYQITWKTVTVNYSVPSNPVSTDLGTCSAPDNVSISYTVASQLTLPNGQSYHFYYGDNPDPAFQNPYGLLSEIDYPDGAWVKYTWKWSDTMNQLAVYPAPGTPAPVLDACIYQYQTPVIASRQVGYTSGSTNPALTQTFTYSTQWASNQSSWTSKSTQQTSTDNIRGLSARTTYSYLPLTKPLQPFASTNYPAQIPLEQRVTYYDWVNSRNPLRTINKTWYNEFQISTEQTTLDNGATSKKVYQYGGSSLPQLTELDEYDFGASSPTRKSLTTYQAFSGAPGILADKPCKVLTQDGSNNTLAETDYLYDGGTAVCGASGSASTTGIGGLPAGTHDETAFAASATTPRGNPTKIIRKCFQACSDSTQAFTYDETGQVLTRTDACGNTACSDVNGTNHTTTYSYTDNYSSCSGAAPPSGSSNAYLTSVTNPLGQSVSYCYGYDDGQLRGSTDLNGLTATYKYADSLRRLTETDNPDGGGTTLAYNDNQPAPTVTASKKINASRNLITVSVRDGMGHVTQTQLASDPQGADNTDTTYDGFGQIYTRSNPYRTGGDPTTSTGTTTYSYDAIGRKLSESYPDGSVLKTAYCGPNTLVTDPTNRWRRSRADGLGFLVEVDEPSTTGATVSACPGSGESIWVTSYVNDVLGNLKSVLQNGSHARSFSFDSLSRMLSSSNPEVGAITYTYDANSNVSTKQDARSITTTYTYDVLNRQLSRTYSNGDPSVTTAYDQNCSGCVNVGRRTSMTDAAGSETWKYRLDKVNYPGSPNVVFDTRNTNGVNKMGTYQYDIGGNLVSLSYPTGSGIINAINPDGRVAEVYGVASVEAINFDPPLSGCPWGAICRTPQGTIYAVSLGQTLGLNILETYNNRLQPQQIKATQVLSPGNPGATAMDLSYNYVDPVNGGNAGHVFQITNNLDTTRSQTFSYDQLNRLTSAQTTSTHATSPAHCWGEVYQYDNVTTSGGGAWGNLTSITPTNNSAYTGCSQESGFSKTVDANNHLSGLTYDASGNTTNDGTYSYPWDAESELKSAGGVTYLYDGDGRRVEKVGSELYWYGPNGEILGITDPAGNATSEYYYLDGRPFARAVGPPALSDAGFEQPGMPGWSDFGGTAGSTLTQINDPARAHSGNSYVQLYSPANGGRSFGVAAPVAVTPGEQISFGGWANMESGNSGAAGWWLLVEDANHNPITSVGTSPFPFPTAGWIYEQASYAVPSNGAYVVLYAQIYQATAPTTLRLDDAFLTVINSVQYYVADELGSARAVTSASGAVLDDSDFYPFGGERSYSSSSGNVFKFEGKERDTETGNDDFGARYYSNRFGRWLSADWSSVPVPIPYANLTNPQTLNLYSMVADDPESFADLDGHISEQAVCEIPTQCSPQTQSQKPPAQTVTQPAQAQNQQTNAAAPTNPDGTPAKPPVPPPPGADGKPNDWVRTPGENGKPDQWDPRDRVPSPKGGQPRARWDDKNGHWDIDDGNKNRTRYLPDGTKVDHYNRPIVKAVLGVAAVGATAYVIYRVIRFLPSLAPPLWWTIPVNLATP